MTWWLGDSQAGKFAALVVAIQLEYRWFYDRAWRHLALVEQEGIECGDEMLRGKRIWIKTKGRLK